MAKASATALQEIPLEHLKCRALVHAWEPTYTERTKVDRSTANVMHCSCLRCGAEKVVVFYQSKGQRKSGPIAYPEGYLIAKREDWGSRAVFNRNITEELFSRLASGDQPKPRTRRKSALKAV